MIILLKQPYFLAFKRQKLMHRVVSQKCPIKVICRGYWAYIWVTQNFFRKSAWAQP